QILPKLPFMSVFSVLRAPESRYVGWPPDAIALVEQACARHGGWDRFERLREITFYLDALGGPLPWMKGQGRSYSPPRHVRVTPHAQRTEFFDWPAPRSIGLFDRGSVRVVGGVGPSFHDPARRAAVPKGRWVPADALYFFGYALA